MNNAVTSDIYKQRLQQDTVYIRNKRLGFPIGTKNSIIKQEVEERIEEPTSKIILHIRIHFISRFFTLAELLRSKHGGGGKLGKM